jgi:DNA-binding NarL/FixJ family response regulator
MTEQEPSIGSSAGVAALRLVVADDAEILRSLLVKAFNRDPRLTVIGEAGDGERALRVVTELEPDVILLDLSMPVLDGLGVLGRLPATCRAVILTGYGEGEMAGKCRELGAREFVEKGTPIPAIVAAILRAGA